MTADDKTAGDVAADDQDDVQQVTASGGITLPAPGHGDGDGDGE